MERAFGPEQKLLQRERKTAAGWLWGAAYGMVLAIALGVPRRARPGACTASRPERDPSTPRFAARGARMAFEFPHGG